MAEEPTPSTSAAKTPHKDTNGVSEIDRTGTSWKIFLAFINNDSTEIGEDDLLKYAKEDLKVDTDKIAPPHLANVPAVLVMFMNMWSGWQFKKEYEAGKFTLEHYFMRFHKFMAFKAKCFKSINKWADLAQGGNGTAEPKMEFSPFCVDIECQPCLLNTVIFTNNGDDVVMKQHVGQTWENLQTRQLINWPNVEVLFHSADLWFVRTQDTEYFRYLNYLPHEAKKKTDDILEEVEALCEPKRRTYYTHRLLEAYCRDLCAALRSKNAPADQLEETETILLDFLEDIRYINLKMSIADKTRITFRLTQNQFIRNKKLVNKSTDELRVGYCEVLCPKVALVLHHFKVKQTPVGFESVGKIKELPNDQTSLVKVLMPSIKYRCTFCNIVYNGKADMLKHLYKDHKMEQHVRCTLCRKQLDVKQMSAFRWKHVCNPSSNK